MDFFLRNKFNIKIIKNLVILLIVFSSLFSFFYFAFDGFSMVITAIVSLVFSVLLFFLMHFIIKKINQHKGFDEKIAKSEVINYQLYFKHIKRFLLIQKKKKKYKTIYDENIYILLSSSQDNNKSILNQMGYEYIQFNDLGLPENFPFQCWLANHSIILAIDINNVNNKMCIQQMCLSLNSIRSKRAINGLLVMSNIDAIVGETNEKFDFISKSRSIIYQINHFCGLNIAIYHIFNDLSYLNDIGKYFAAVDQKIKEQPFGAIYPETQEIGFDQKWFQSSFDELTATLLDNVSSIIHLQLNTAFRNAILSAPFQFSLCQSYLTQFLDNFYHNDNYHMPLFFRGFFFVNVNEFDDCNDLLAEIAIKSLSCSQYLQPANKGFSQILFIQNLMTNGIIVEKNITATNTKKENIFAFSQLVYGVFCGLIIFGVITLLKLNVDFQNMRELDANKSLQVYKEQILKTPYEIGSLSSNILNLFSLYNINQNYNANIPWYILSFIPDSNLTSAIEKAYKDTLNNVFIPSILDDVKYDLYVNQKLNNKNEILYLLNIFNLINSKKEINIDTLNSYFRNELQLHGQHDHAVLGQFSHLLHDTNHINNKNITFDPNLLAVSENIIKHAGIENLLYEHIKKQPLFAKTIDIEDDLGKNFKLVFKFRGGKERFFIPYFFTPQGFNELDLSINSPLIKQSLLAYEGVVGVSPSTSEIYRITKELNTMYFQEYVNFWHDFIADFDVKPINNLVELRDYFDVLSTNSDNPLMDFYTEIAKYTRIELIQISGSEPLSSMLNIDPQKQLLAKKISDSFKQYQLLVKPDSNGKSSLSHIRDHLLDAKIWLDDFYENTNPLTHAFFELSKPLSRDNPISSLYIYAKQKPRLAKNTLHSMAKYVDNTFIKMGKKYLNTHWYNQVYLPYEKQIQPYFPFDNAASNDVNISDVKSFFSNNGVIDSFYKNNLLSFRHDFGGSPYLTGLIPESKLTINDEIWQSIKQAKHIQEALNINDAQFVGFDFKLRPVSMSADILEFNISRNKPVFIYHHGPMFWTTQKWSTELISDDNLSIKVVMTDGNIIKENTYGMWSWFRLLSANIVNTTGRLATIQFTFGENTVNLLVQTKSKYNPFESTFFSSFSLPKKL